MSAAHARTRAGATTRLHVFADSRAFGRALARAARARVAPVTADRFPDGESLVRVRPPVGRHAVLVRTLYDPNPKLVETILVADALRRPGAEEVTLVAPHLPYMRQDAVFAPGAERRIRAAGVRRLASCDTIPHPTNAIRVAPLVATALRGRHET